MSEPRAESIAPSPLELVQEHSLTSALKLELERMIFDGSIRAGERLNESTLAARFGTSRGPLREALQALGEQGLVSFTRNRGAFVKQMSIAEADDLYDLRSALDDEVGRKLAGALTPAQSRGLEALLREMDQDAKRNDIRRYYPNNLRFHDLLVTYAGNGRLAEIYRRITKELHLFRLQGLQASGAMHSNAEHWKILKAIQSGSADRAAKAMRAHIEAARADAPGLGASLGQNFELLRSVPPGRVHALLQRSQHPALVERDGSAGVLGVQRTARPWPGHPRGLTRQPLCLRHRAMRRAP